MKIGDKVRLKLPKDSDLTRTPAVYKGQEILKDKNPVTGEEITVLGKHIFETENGAVKIPEETLSKRLNV